MNAITGFQAAKIINLLLKEDGISKEIKPQMIYNYIRKGTIASVDGPLRNGTPQKLVPMDELATFYKSYKEGLRTSGNTAKTEDLVQELKNLL